MLKHNRTAFVLILILLFPVICFSDGKNFKSVLQMWNAAGGGAGEEPASGTVLAGDSTEYAGSTFNIQHDFYYYPTGAFTATWAESAASTTAATIEVYGIYWDGGSLTMCVHNGADGTLVTNGCATVAAAAGTGWKTATFSTPPTITKGNTYYLTVGPSINYTIIVPSDGATAACREDSGTYESPATLSCDTGWAYSFGIRIKK